MASCSLRVVEWGSHHQAGEIKGFGILCDGHVRRYSASFFPLNSLMWVEIGPGFDFLQCEFEVSARSTNTWLCNRRVYPIVTKMTVRGFCSMIASQYTLPSIARIAGEVRRCSPMSLGISI